jgi:hypothetical protein
MSRPEQAGNFLSEAPLGIFPTRRFSFLPSPSKRPEVGLAPLLSDN